MPNPPTPPEEFAAALFAGDLPSALGAVKRALGDGMPPAHIHWRLIQPALYEVGDAWERAQVGIADEHVATAIAERVLADLYPKLVGSTRRIGPLVVLAVTPGERHSIGLRMVADVLEGAGHRVVVLRTGASHEALLELVRGLRPAVVGLSITSSTLIPDLVAAVRAMRALAVPVIVGGRAVPPSLEALNGVWIAGRSDDAVQMVADAAEHSRLVARPGSGVEALAKVQISEGATRDAYAERVSELAQLEGESLREIHRAEGAP